MARYGRRAFVEAVAVTASLGAFSGSLERYRSRGFERLGVHVSSDGSLWMGPLGFHTVDDEPRWEDVFGIGDREYVAPRDFEVYSAMTTLYTPVEFVAAPMAGYDAENPMRATLTVDGDALASGEVESEDDALSLSVE